MSSHLGARTFNEPAMGSSSSIGSKRRRVAEETAREVDLEIQKILDFESIRAKEYLERHQPELMELREKLMTEKTLGLDGLKAIFKDKDFKQD